MSGLVLIASLSSVLPFSLLEARSFDNLYPSVIQNAKFVQLRWHIRDIKLLQVHQECLQDELKILEGLRKRPDLQHLVQQQEESIELNKAMIEMVEKRIARFKRELPAAASKQDD